MSTRNPILAGSPLTSGGLTSARAYSANAAMAIVPATVAGHNRAMIEHAIGRQVDADQPTVAPKNARNLVGEDHSGGLWGRSLKHTFAALSWCELHDPTEVYGAKPPRIVSGSVYGLDEDFLIAVPGCHLGGAYESATVRALVEVRTEAATTDVRLRIKGEASASSYDIDLDGTATGILSDTIAVPMLAGKLNKINLRFYRVGNGGSAGNVEADLLGVFFSLES